MNYKYLKMATVLLLGLQLAGCYTDYGPVEVETTPISPSGAGVAAVLKPAKRSRSRSMARKRSPANMTSVQWLRVDALDRGS